MRVVGGAQVGALGTGPVEVEQQYLNNKLKTVTAYYGELVVPSEESGAGTLAGSLEHAAT